MQSPLTRLAKPFAALRLVLVRADEQRAAAQRGGERRQVGGERRRVHRRRRRHVRRARTAHTRTPSPPPFSNVHAGHAHGAEEEEAAAAASSPSAASGVVDCSKYAAAASLPCSSSSADSTASASGPTTARGGEVGDARVVRGSIAVGFGASDHVQLRCFGARACFHTGGGAARRGCRISRLATRTHEDTCHVSASPRRPSGGRSPPCCSSARRPPPPPPRSRPTWAPTPAMRHRSTGSDPPRAEAELVVVEQLARLRDRRALSSAWGGSAAPPAPLPPQPSRLRQDRLGVLLEPRPHLPRRRRSCSAPTISSRSSVSSSSSATSISASSRSAVAIPPMPGSSGRRSGCAARR